MLKIICIYFRRAWYRTIFGMCWVELSYVLNMLKSAGISLSIVWCTGHTKIVECFKMISKEQLISLKPVSNQECLEVVNLKIKR